MLYVIIKCDIIIIIYIFNVIYLLNDTWSVDVIYFYVTFIYTDILFIHIFRTAIVMYIYVILLCDNICISFFINFIYLLNVIHLVFFITSHLIIYLTACSIIFNLNID